MRDALKNAIHNAILFECKLPHQESGIDKSCLSSQNDICFTIPLQKGYHPFALHYFEDYEGEYLGWSWRTPSMSKLDAIPTENLYIN